MVYLSIRHQVNDYSTWRKVYDSHKQARDQAGLEELFLLQNRDNNNEIFLMFRVGDIQKAKQFMLSEDLNAAMKRAGVMGTPEIDFMEEVTQLYA
ncbi:hypothetical protein [Pontibacter ruber]|uniref:Cyclase n=1 Tax=Pontibacter ruber TaxID=1343895 RepID=A0ABW5D0I7_9BACT|nr:hypothetical protein [Pontibacter ruber]